MHHVDKQHPDRSAVNGKSQAQEIGTGGNKKDISHEKT